MPDQPAQNSMLDSLRETYKEIAEDLKKPGPTLTVETVEARGKEEPRPADRLLDKHSPEAAEKLRQADPASQARDGEKAPRQAEARPTELKHEHSPPGTKPGPTIAVGGITFTSQPATLPHHPEPQDLLITSSRSGDQRTEQAMPHEKLIAKVEGRPKPDLLELAQARLAAVRESDKAHARGNRSLSLFADPGKGRRLK